MTNYEKIKQMSIEEMATLLWDIESRDSYYALFNGEKEAKQWLESEVQQ